MLRGLFKSVLGGPSTKRSVEIQPQGVPYPHNCTVGTCGSCKTLLLQGQVKAASDFGYVLSKQELDAGYILACQAVPREATTVVRIADLGADLPPPISVSGRICRTELLTHDILKVVIECDRPTGTRLARIV